MRISEGGREDKAELNEAAANLWYGLAGLEDAKNG